MKKIIISGASGFVGKSLLEYFKQHPQYEIYVLVRQQQTSSREIHWEPYQKQIDLKQLEGAFAFIHLSGDNVGSGLWTKPKKKRMRESRLSTTAFLTESLLKLSNPPKVFIGASGVGYYEPQEEGWIDEQSQKGTGFFPDLCQEWENASSALSKKNINVSRIRFGMILSHNGGALKKLKTIFKWGLGSPFGNGKQYMPWIHIEDVCQIVQWSLDEKISGIINGTAPNPVTNKDFTRSLNKYVSRPTLFSVPAFAIKLALGEMGEELFLKSLRVKSSYLEEVGFSFKYPDFKSVLFVSK